MDITKISSALASTGLIIRGTFATEADDDLSPEIKTVVIIGNVGSDIWPVFSVSPEFDRSDNPMDDWSRRVIEKVAIELDCAAVYPFDGPPYVPFQRWAQKAEPVWPSPIGPLIHPVYGLWHAYRGALLFKEDFAAPSIKIGTSPCDKCLERPCLSTCPVNAFSESGYDVPACADHLRSSEGSDCMNGGCLARRSCPVGQGYQYSPGHAAFHMDHFLKARPMV
jgi:ferredoxin-like protein FixX